MASFWPGISVVAACYLTEKLLAAVIVRKCPSVSKHAWMTLSDAHVPYDGWR
jgi:hypothetical protein